MTKNVLLCGMGGQGIVLTSHLIALAAMERGVEARGAGTIGMAQRDGNVANRVRIGKEIYSPLMPRGGTDAIIGFKPTEVVRCLPYLKKGGCMMVSPAPIQPATASLTGDAYTNREMMECLKHAGENLVAVDAASIGMECGFLKVMNVALLGTAIASGLTGTSLKEMGVITEKRVSGKPKDMNTRVLKLGATTSAVVR